MNIKTLTQVIKTKLHTISKLKFAVFLLLLVLCSIFLNIVVFTKPSNNRNWEAGQDRLVHIEINNTLVKVQGIRDFHFKPKEITSANYIDRLIDINKIENVWFLVEPFGKNDVVAHTYFVFDIQDDEPIAVSVEARREKGEKYDAVLGAFNKYELIYIWGSESDETIRRVIFENNKLYMYPLNISENGKKQLFLQLAKTTKDLETTPRFYNSLFSNCTNELAKSANAIKKGAIPFNLALFLPGLSVKELYKLGHLPNDTSIEELIKSHYISDFVRENYNKPNFSDDLRIFLKNKLRTLVI